MTEKRKLLGEILLEHNIITQEQLQQALQQQKQTGGKLGQVMVNLSFIGEQQLLEVLEYALGIPRVQLNQINIESSVLKILPGNIMRQHKVLPLNIKQGRLTLAMSDPLNYEAIDIVHMLTNLNVVPVLAGTKELDLAIQQYTSLQMDTGMQQLIGELGQLGTDDALIGNNNELDLEDDAPIIRVVNSMFKQAVHGRASDIHIEPLEQEVRVRFRIDGELHQVLNLPKRSLAALASRVKIMGNMDISEKRLPQDGRTQMTVEGRDIDFRISSLPSIHGEKIVLRILDRTNALIDLDVLGFSPDNHTKVTDLISRPHGMLIIAGPTGSGKTTTLYSILHRINTINKNIITLEDPVEYSLPGIIQVQINIKAGLTFAAGLRTVLRQDPDIIMVGEIRDQETAELGIKSALTGHLLLSTLHTNSAAGTIARLVNMGIENFLLASSLAGVISQRLVRKLCTACRQPYRLDQATARRLELDSNQAEHVFYKAVGCTMCRHTGYSGRLALYEVFVLGPKVRAAINRGIKAEDVLEQEAIMEGLVTIKQDGIQKAGQGLTSLEEVMKAVYLGG